VNDTERAMEKRIIRELTTGVHDFESLIKDARNETDGIHFNPADPAGSIEAFMERLREVTEVMVDAPSNMDEGFDILSLAWPYKP